MGEWFASAWKDLLNWLEEIWNGIVDFFTELPLIILEGVLDAVAFVFESIPVPSFLSQGLNSLLSGVDPAVIYFLDQSGFDTALGIVGAGYLFRLLRKLFTLFQW